MGRLTLVLLLLFFAVATTPIPVHAQQTSALFEAGSAAFAEGDYLRALSLFEDAREAGSAGPAVHYNIAVCQFRLGRYAEADAEFRGLADDFPEMRGLALYNIGLVRLRQGREAEARELFEQVRADGSDASLVQLAEAALRRIAPASTETAPSYWISLLDFALGYDDNVALVDDASLPAAQSSDSAFAELFGFLSGPRGPDPGLRFDASAYLVRYSDASEYDQTAVRVGGVYAWRAASWQLEAGPQFNYSTLDGEGFEQRIGIDIRARRPLSATTTLTLQATHDEVDNAASRFAYLAGTRQQLGISVERRSGPGRLGIGYEHEQNDREDPNVAPTRDRLWVRYRYSPSPDWSVDGRIAIRGSRYDAPAALEREDLTALTLGYVRRLSGGWEINASYRWYDNDSDLDLLSYARNRVSISLGKTF